MAFSPPRAGGPVEDDGLAIPWRPVAESALKYWWVILLLGPPLGAGLAYAAWVYTPAPYSAKAELYLQSYQDRIAFRTNEAMASFGTRKQTLQKRIRSRDVATAALRDAALAQSPTLRGREDPVRYLQGKLRVGSNGTEFITVSMSGERPEDLPVIVNGVVRAFMEEVVVGGENDRRRRLIELRDVLSGIDAELKLKQKELAEFVENSTAGVASTTMMEQRQASQLKMRELLRGELARVDLELIQTRARQTYYDAKTEGDLELPEEVLDVLVRQEEVYKEAASRAERAASLARRYEANQRSDSPKLADARAEAASAEGGLEELAESLKPQVLQRLREQRLRDQQKGGQKIGDTIAALETLRAALDSESRAIQFEESRSGAESLDLLRMEKDLERRESMREQVASEIERRQFELRNAEMPVAVHETAVLPTSRDTGKRMKMAAMGGLGGFGAVAGLVALLGSLGHRVTRTAELERALPVNVVGALPHLPKGGAAGGKASVRWEGALRESIDAARTVLLREIEQHGRKVILVSSAVSGEGKTALSCHLATSLARTGRRVALIDADLRRPAVHRVFGAEVSPGLADVLRGDVTHDDAVVGVESTGLEFVPAGEICEEALAGLGTANIDAYLQSLRERYDCVLIDSPPVLPVSDGLVLARSVDGVMFAVRRGVSRVRQVSAAIGRFESIGAPVLGAVAIGMSDTSGAYGDYAGRYPYTRTRPKRIDASARPAASTI